MKHPVRNKLFHLIASGLAGAICGFFLGPFVALVDYWLRAPREGVVEGFFYISRTAAEYGVGAMTFGGLAGLVDFVITSVWPSTTKFVGRAVAWALIGLGVVGVIVAAGWPQHDVPTRILIVAAFCCLGGIFGASMVFAVQLRMGLKDL